MFDVSKQWLKNTKDDVNEIRMGKKILYFQLKKYKSIKQNKLNTI